MNKKCLILLFHFSNVMPRHGLSHDVHFGIILKLLLSKRIKAKCNKI